MTIPLRLDTPACPVIGMSMHAGIEIGPFQPRFELGTMQLSFRFSVTSTSIAEFIVGQSQRENCNDFHFVPHFCYLHHKRQVQQHCGDKHQPHGVW